VENRITVLTTRTSVARRGGHVLSGFRRRPWDRQFYVLIGAEAIPPADPTAPLYANLDTNSINLKVTQATLDDQSDAGNNQSGTPAALATQLQVEVETASGTTWRPVVNWTCLPPGASLSRHPRDDTGGAATGNRALAANALGHSDHGHVPVPGGAGRDIHRHGLSPLTLTGRRPSPATTDGHCEHDLRSAPVVSEQQHGRGANVGVQFSVTDRLASSKPVNTVPTGARKSRYGAPCGRGDVTATSGAYTQAQSDGYAAVPPDPPLTAATSKCADSRPARFHLQHRHHPLLRDCAGIQAW